MNIINLITELEALPGDTMLYDSICSPTWYVADSGEIVLAGAPCPVQTVKQLREQLETITNQDLPSQDISFRRKVHQDHEIYMATIVERNNLPTLVVEPITTRTVKEWKQYSNDHMVVDVAIGAPSYILSSDKIKILVNKSYYQYLGVNGRRKYIEDLLYVRSFTWRDGMGAQKWYHEEAWNSNQCNHSTHKPSIQLDHELNRFDGAAAGVAFGSTWVDSNLVPTPTGTDTNN